MMFCGIASHAPTVPFSNELFHGREFDPFVSKEDTEYHFEIIVAFRGEILGYARVLRQSHARARGNFHFAFLRIFRFLTGVKSFNYLNKTRQTPRIYTYV